MPKQKAAFIYREEAFNSTGQWVCCRETKDKSQYDQWRSNYANWLTGDDKPPSWMRPHRYLRGQVQWEDDPDPIMLDTSEKKLRQIERWQEKFFDKLWI